MRAAVRSAFVGYSTPLEGCVPWPYLDILGLVTIGIGCLVEPISEMVRLPFVRPTGARATQDEIARAWQAVKCKPELAKLGHRAAEHVTSIRLTQEGIETLALRRLDANDAHLSARFPRWESWPADAQLAVHSIAWAVGPRFRFPRMEAALRAGDFALAATECTIREAGNPGVIPRNRAQRVLLRNAAVVVRSAGMLDPSVLYWPEALPEGSDRILTPADLLTRG